MNTIDLHSHSIASLDGQFEPEELIDLAIQSGLKYYAIADHDVVDSLYKAKEYAKDKDLHFIPAVELSVDMDGTFLHILSYNIDFNDSRYLEIADLFKTEVVDYGRKLIAKTLEFGFKFDPEKPYTFRKDHLICEEIVGACVLSDPRNDNDERLKEFRPGGKYSDNPRFNFYKYLCTPGNPLYIPYTSNISMEYASKLIHETGGKMFLAHPNHNIGHNEELLNKIMSYGLDGIEVFSSYHSPSDIEYYYQKAKANNLYMSVGSDFHGESKPAIKLGSINYDEEQLNKTIKFILS